MAKRMICLDTNYLIRGIVQGTRESVSLIEWVRSGEQLIVPMPVWFEFLCGPVTENQVMTLRSFLSEILPFGESEACESARLFNAIQRKRQHRIDSMIAGTAIIANAKLATNNRADFEPFVRYGLKIF